MGYGTVVDEQSEVGGVDAAAEADTARWVLLAVNGLWYAGG